VIARPEKSVQDQEIPVPAPVEDAPAMPLEVEQKQWRAIGVSARGSSHIKMGLPCQDAHLWTVAPGNVLLLSVADGAGSASLSQIGSQIAVRTAIEQATMEMHRLNATPALLGDDEVWTSILFHAVDVAREAVEKEAGEQGVAPREMDTACL